MKFCGIPEFLTGPDGTLYATASAQTATGGAGGRMLAESWMQVYPAALTRDREAQRRLWLPVSSQERPANTSPTLRSPAGWCEVVAIRSRASAFQVASRLGRWSAGFGRLGAVAGACA